jgi:hypothetical protein
MAGGMSKRMLIIALLAGCTSSPTEVGVTYMPPDGGPSPCDTGGAPALFRYGLSEAPFGTPIAAGGAWALVEACTTAGMPEVAAARSTNPAVISIGSFEVEANLAGMMVTGGQAGDADLVLLDAAGAEIARTTLHVAVAELVVDDSGWRPAPGPTIVAGKTEYIHVDTVLDGVSLVGVGAVQFELTGPLMAVYCDELFDGDGICIVGKAGDGDGAVVITSPGVRLEVPVKVVPGA